MRIPHTGSRLQHVQCFVYLVLIHTVAGIPAGRTSHDTAMDSLNVQAQTSNETFKIQCPENAEEIIDHCQRDLVNLLFQGYPWYFVPKNTTPKDSFDGKVESSRVTGLPGDPLDVVNHMCKVLEKTETCLQESNVNPACLIVGNFQPPIDQSTFNFLCHRQKIDANLLHSLQCLSDTRIITMLDFHILGECWNGDDILNTVMHRTKNALFYNLNVKPTKYVPGIFNAFFCFPSDRLATCVKPIIS